MPAKLNTYTVYVSRSRREYCTVIVDADDRDEALNLASEASWDANWEWGDNCGDEDYEIGDIVCNIPLTVCTEEEEV